MRSPRLIFAKDGTETVMPIDLITTIVWRGRPRPRNCYSLKSLVRYIVHFTAGGHLLSRKNGMALMLGVAAGVALLMFRLPPIPQPASYHEFADQRPWLGIPNFGNVISNAAFAIVGICGIAFIRRPSRRVFLDRRERWPYVGVFIGLLLTAFGSAYYHLVPNNAHLVWDRPPMTVVFGSLLAAIVAEHISVPAGLQLLP